jgi:hypothetical protein
MSPPCLTSNITGRSLYRIIKEIMLKYGSEKILSGLAGLNLLSLVCK